ncbi:AAC(3) family N-acetyltransferase [Grimontia hollisae]|uniref:AAC(3) family N-acetyltransferase n=1 Tax=Grimontia hollisae TaxID=673 RepID=UPI0013039700|nr:AAC(3) family N-acetyltransferase [Grimontia hollisae]
MKHCYTKTDLKNTFKQVGIEKGDLVFCHTNVGFLGMPEGAKNKEDALQIILDALIQVIGEEEGTLVVPTFTYSFSENTDFDPENSKSNCGMFSEYVKDLPNSIRNHDPSVSVAAIGLLANDICGETQENTYSEKGVFGKMLRRNGKILNINFDAGSTFLHYVERALNVPYRYDKTFVGKIIINGVTKKVRSTIWVRNHNIENSEAYFGEFNKLAVKKGLYVKGKVGRGIIGCISMHDAFHLVEKEIVKNPWLLTNRMNK